MSHTPDLSPRAQAILRAIENEAQARRQNDVSAHDDAPPPPTEGGVLPADDAAARLTSLVDHVVAHTETIRAHARQVEQSLDSLSAALLEAENPSAAAPSPATERRPESARVTAIELALSGSSRGEVQAHLEQELGVGETAAILDDVFGAGTPDSARMPWNG